MKYLTAKQILERFNIKSPTTLWRWQQEHQKIYKAPFPAPVRLSKGAQSLWDKAHIDDWERNYFRNNKYLRNKESLTK